MIHTKVLRTMQLGFCKDRGTVIDQKPVLKFRNKI